MQPESPFDRRGPPDSTTFDFFFSFRSPYSYLALPQIAAGIQWNIHVWAGAIVLSGLVGLLLSLLPTLKWHVSASETVAT